MRVRVIIVAMLLTAPVASPAQEVGTCETGQAKRYLDINGVKAAIYNTGGLFWKGNSPEYEVPVGTTANAIFAANLWIGGLVDGELRMSATTRGPWELWPGPIPDDGSPPQDCSQFDRIYKVSRYELTELDSSGNMTPDIRDWPRHLGAPVVDGDGNPDNYDVQAGDRPKVEGDQTLWWIMNDLGNKHEWSNESSRDIEADPMGIEVRATAFAASSPDPAINLTTVYRYVITNRSDNTITDTYFGSWVDADVGSPGDDFVGSDSTLGLAYAWNGDDFDEGADGYGDRPPAIGYTVVDGPMVDGKRLPMTNFVYYNRDSTVQGHPSAGQDAYNYLKSRWRDGVPVTYGGTGRSFSESPTTWMFTGRPPDFWSEEDLDRSGTRTTPSDRRFVWSTGPFTMAPGESHEIVFTIIFAQGDDRYDSLYELIDMTPRVKEAIRSGLPTFSGEPPTESPELLAPADGAFGQPINPVIRWTEVAGADRYLLEIRSSTSIDSVDVTVAPYPVAVGASTITRELDLSSDQIYSWRVAPRNAAGYGPPSDWSSFTTGTFELAGVGPLTIDGTPGGDPAFIQVEGMPGFDPCGPDATSTYGCAEVGGNNVYGSFNGQRDWVMYHQGAGPESVIGQFVPNDFEIRVTEEGSFGYHPFSDGVGNAHWVPFELWDIEEVGAFGVNDTLDDHQLVPNIFSDNGGVCEFGFGEIPEDPFGLGWGVTDRIYAYYPIDGATYDDWQSAIQPIVDADPESCPVSPETDAASDLIDLARGRPLQGLIFMMDPISPHYRPEMIPVGNVIRFLTIKPVPPIPSAPASGSVVGSEVDLFWQLPAGEDSTMIQLFTAMEPPILVEEWLVAGSSFTTPALDAGAYLWRVAYRAQEWSDAWAFVVVPGTSTESDRTGLPTELTLRPAYPNPLSDQTAFNFGMPEAGHLSITVYDLLGRRVATVAEGNRAAGWHTETWQPDLRSGVYFVTIESGDSRRTQPVTVVR